MDVFNSLLLIFVVLFVLQYFKWILFAIFSPLYRWRKKRDKVKWLERKQAFFEKSVESMISGISSVRGENNIRGGQFFKGVGSTAVPMDGLLF